MRTDRKRTNMAQNVLFVIIKQCFGHIFVSESKKGPILSHLSQQKWPYVQAPISNNLKKKKLLNWLITDKVLTRKHKQNLCLILGSAKKNIFNS